MNVPFTEEQRKALLFTQGKLKSWTLPHQQEFYDSFEDWNKRRQTRAYRKLSRSRGSKYNRVFVLEAGRKWGKSGAAIALGVQEAIRRPGSKGMIAMPYANTIAGVVVPLINEIFRDAPTDYRPELRTTNVDTGDHLSLYIPAVKSSIRLKGLDLHIKALRGPWLDWCIITEAGFVNGLDGVIKSEIQPMMVKRPWAWILLESSTPLTKDHPFTAVFKEDALLRTGDDLGAAYKRYTIDDNTSLSAEEREEEILSNGGYDDPTVRREFFCEQVRDEKDAAVPEYRDYFEQVVNYEVQRGHLRPTHFYGHQGEGECPRHAYCGVGIDPAMSQPAGLVFGYLDWKRDVLVIQASLGGPSMTNVGTAQLAAMIKAMELKLWGTEHQNARTSHRDPRVTDPLMSIRGAQLTGDKRVWYEPQGSVTWWSNDQNSLRPNPYVRVCDTNDPRLISDFQSDHQLIVQKAEKGPNSFDSDLKHLRNLFTTAKIEIMDCPENEDLIKQLRSGELNDTRKDFRYTPSLGHLDCISALKYLVRFIPWTARDPQPPVIRDHNLPDVLVPPHLQKKTGGTQLPKPAVLGGFQSNLFRRR